MLFLDIGRAKDLKKDKQQHNHTGTDENFSSYSSNLGDAVPTRGGSLFTGIIGLTRQIIYRHNSFPLLNCHERAERRLRPDHFGICERHLDTTQTLWKPIRGTQESV